MIDSSEKCKCQLAFERQNSRDFEKRSKMRWFELGVTEATLTATKHLHKDLGIGNLSTI